jgi:hypothetical protein
MLFVWLHFDPGTGEKVEQAVDTDGWRQLARDTTFYPHDHAL